MRVVIAGGTGFVGKRLTAILSSRGDEVTLLSRHASPPNTLSYDQAREAIAPAEAIVNLAGAGVLDEKWSPERLELLRRSRIDTTRIVASAIESKKAVLVNASAVGYYGTRLDDEELDESSPPGDDVLAKLCVDWEEAARAAPCRVAVARIGIVLGKEGGALGRMVPMFRKFIGGPIGSGKQWWSWIHLEDTARAIVHAIDKRGFEGPFNVTAPAPATMNDVARKLGEVLRRPAAIRVPEFVLRMTLGDGAVTLLTGQRALPKKLLETNFDFRYGNLRAALQSSI